MLEHGVRRDGRPVHDAADRRAVREAGDRLDDRRVVVRRRRKELADRRAAVGALEDDVGERPADVDSDPRAVVRDRHAR